MVDREERGDRFGGVLDPVVRDGAVPFGSRAFFGLVVDHVAFDPAADRRTYLVCLDEAGHRPGDLRLPRPALAGEEHAVQQRHRVQPEAGARDGAVVQRPPRARPSRPRIQSSPLAPSTVPFITYAEASRCASSRLADRNTPSASTTRT